MFFQKFACGLGFAGRGYARKMNPKKDNQQTTKNEERAIKQTNNNIYRK